MNLNKGCIEIGYTGGSAAQSTGMNLNKGCIEILLYENHLLVQA